MGKAQKIGTRREKRTDFISNLPSHMTIGGYASVLPWEQIFYALLNLWVRWTVKYKGRALLPGHE